MKRGSTKCLNQFRCRKTVFLLVLLLMSKPDSHPFSDLFIAVSIVIFQETELESTYPVQGIIVNNPGLLGVIQKPLMSSVMLGRIQSFSFCKFNWKIKQS